MPYPMTMAERRRMRALRRGEMARRDAWCTAVEVAVTVGWALFIAAALLLAACAGADDYRDRTQGLGASMVPDATTDVRWLAGDL